MATDVKQIVLAGADDHDLTQLADYEAVGGYQALAKARAMTPKEVTDELMASELRGRGGAFFPTGRKWSFVPSKEQLPKPHYLVVNADESEPGSFKDNEILSRVPHRFIEGCLITAHAIDCTNVFVYIRGEYSGPYAILVEALEQLRSRPEIRGERDDRAAPRRRRVHLRRGDRAARVARGQARPAALQAAVPGRRGSLRGADGRQQRRDDHHRPAGDRDGRCRVRQARRPELARHARRVALGQRRERRQLRDRDRDDAARADLRHRRRHPRRARAEGGRAGRLVDGDPDADEIDVGYDFDSLGKLGTAMGSAGIVVLDDRCCIVQLGIRFSEFYEHESCGKCTPCREGTRWLTAILRKLEDGRASQADLDLLLDVCDRINGKCLCPLGDSDAIIIASYVAKFRDEFQAHIDARRAARYGGSSSLDGVLAPIQMHAHGAHEEVPA